MRKKSIGRELVICQCLSQLPLEDFECPLIDYGKQLTTKALIKIFVAAQLDGWDSYSTIAEKLGAHSKLRKNIGIKKISRSQLSRRINDLPTEYLQNLYVKLVKKLQESTKGLTGLPNGLGILKIIDSTKISLPVNLCDWAYISKDYTAVKMHTRLVVASKDITYPDKIVPSSGKLSDIECTNDLVEEPGAIYVMDRGYASRENFETWEKKGISYVVRVTKSLRLGILEEFVATHPSVIRDAKVSYNTSKKPVRCIEFLDDKGNYYRILTDRFDLTDEQVLEIYRARWMIELFFKWIKQHLRFTKIWSTKPQGIWNQMFCALIAYVLSLMLKLQTQSERTPYRFFKLLQTYLYNTVSSFKRELKQKKSKTSKGRQKVPNPKPKIKPEFGNVAKDKTERKKKKHK